MAVTFGSVRMEDGSWHLELAPDVAMKMKRWFTRAVQHRTGVVVLSDTPEVAADLEWMLSRYPLVASTDVIDYMAKRAETYRAKQELVVEVLSGTTSVGLTSGMEPARPPRSYQELAAELAAATGRLLLTDELGLGKTFSSLLLLAAEGALPALVVTLTPLPRQWVRELSITFPLLTAHVLTSGQPYDITKRCRGRDPDVLIMNYQKMAGWADKLAGVVQTVIFDEMQELRRDGTQKYEAACVITHKARYAMGLTATPVYTTAENCGRS